MARLGKRLFLLISILAFSTACVGVAWADEAGQQQGEQPQGVQDEGVNIDLGFVHAGVFLLSDDGFGPSFAPMADDPQLAEQLAVVKARVVAAYDGLEGEVDISDLRIPISQDNLYAIWGSLNEASYENPSLFYMTANFEYEYRDDEDGTYFASLSLVYNNGYELADIPAMQEEYEAAMAGLLSWVPADAIDVQKAKVAHDWLVRNCVYNTDAANTAGPESYGSPNPWNAYGALVDKSPVCQGYSLAFIDVMNRLGIESSFVANDEEQHAWNRVKLDGDWYNLDVTWDDPCWMTRGEGVTDGGFDATPETTFFLKSDAWFKADAQANPDNAAHASWSPEGVEGTNTQYDGFATDDWPTYSGPAATDPDLPSDLSEWGYRIEFGSAEGASFHEIDGVCFYVLDDGVSSVTPAVTVYYEGPNDYVELPASAYDTAYRMMNDSSTSMSPTWSDVDAPLEVGHYYDVTAQAKPGSGYTNSVSSDGFWVTTKNNLWVYSASLGDEYAVPISGWPGVRYDIPKGADYDLTLSFDGATLTEGTDYTVEWCNRDINPDMLDDEAAHQDAILGSKPTETGRYYVHYKGKDPYFEDDVVMFDIVRGIRVDRTDAESYDPLFSDGTATYRVRVLGFDGEQGTDWNLELQLGEQGTFNGDTEEFANPLVSGTDYSFDAETGTLVLYGDKVFERCNGKSVEINAAVFDLSDSSLLYRIVETVEVVEPWVDYNFMQDRKMLAGDSDWIYPTEDVEYANAEYPDGVYGSYEILDVKVATSTPEQEGAEVVKVTPYDYDDSSHSWHLETLNNGTATIEVTYEDIHGEEQSYTFTITVVSDLYVVEVSSQDGRMQALPGQSIDLIAEGTHEASYAVDMDESFTYSWSLGEGSEYATIVPDTNDSSRATVTFNALPEDVDFLDEDVQVLVTMQGEDDEGQLVDLATNNLTLRVCSDYYELYPEEINPNMEIGESLTVTPEVRYYSSASQSASGYDLVDNATFYWDSSSSGFEFKNADGDTIGSSGSSEPVTITRTDRRNGGIWLAAEWVDDSGKPCDANKQYEMDYRDYSISLNSNEYRLYGDGTLDVWVTYNQSLNTQYVWPVVTVGIYDWGNQTWTQTFTEGQEYTVDLEGGIITLDGTKILAACDEGAEIRVFAQMMVGGTDSISGNDATSDYYTLMACEPHVDYRPLQDVDVLPGQGGSVDRVYSAHVESAEYPNGADESYEVTDVVIENQQPEVAGEDVISLVKQYGDDDPTSVDYWWSYEALNYGTATIKVTYKTLEGQTQGYTFNVNVVRDLYRVNVSSVDGTHVALPGKSIELRAEGTHESVNGGGGLEGLWYDWSLGEGVSPETVTITADPSGDSSKVTVTFAPLDPEGPIPDAVDAKIVVKLMDQDNEGQSIERARGDIVLTAMPFYYEVLPVSIDRDLAVGETEEVTAQVLYHSVFSEEPVPVEDATFYWEFNDEAVEITDSTGLAVDEDDIYQGTQVQFTIKRLSNWATGIRLHAEWLENWGGERSEVRELQLDEIAEVGPAAIDCSWGTLSTNPTNASWDVVDGASYYEVWASFDDGENSSQSNTFTVDATQFSSSYGFADFFDANGAGEYGFSVGAYDSEGNLIAEGAAAPVQFYQVAFVIRTFDENDQLVDEEGGSAMFEMGDSGLGIFDDRTLLVQAGEVSINATADTEEGFELQSVTVTPAGGQPSVYTTSPDPFMIDNSYTIAIVFKQNLARVPVKLDLGSKGAGYANEICSLINNDDAAANATASGSVITFQVYQSQSVGDTIDYLGDLILDEDSTGLTEAEGFSYSFGTKPNMTDYEDYSELNAERYSTVAVSENQVFYALWMIPIDSVQATVETPLCGMQMAIEEGVPPVDTPQVTLTGAEHVKLGMAFWAKDDGLFLDKIVGDNLYTAAFAMQGDFGYYIPADAVVMVNGQAAETSTIFGGPRYTLDIRAEHVWGEWTTVTPPTAGVDGLEKRVCSACDAEETHPIPALSGHNVTIVNGSADKATAEEGETVTVTAAPPAAYAQTNPAITGWCIDGVWSNSTAATQTVTMPDHDLVVMARYRVWDDETTDDSTATVIGQLVVTDLTTNTTVDYEPYNETAAVDYSAGPGTEPVATMISDSAASITSKLNAVTENGLRKGDETEKSTNELDIWDRRAYNTSYLDKDGNEVQDTDDYVVELHLATGSYGKETAYTTKRTVSFESVNYLNIGATEGGSFSLSEVRYDGSAGASANHTGYYTIFNNSTMTLTATPDEGYRFAGWYEGVVDSSSFVYEPTETLVSTDNPYVYTQTDDAVICAVFEEVPAETVSLELNTDWSMGSFKVNGEIWNKKYEGMFYTGTTVSLEAIPKSGYEFCNWGMNVGGVEKISTLNPMELELNENTVVYAGFAQSAPVDSYTVSFDAGGGSGEMDAVQVASGDSYTLPTTCTFTPPAGYKFAGWTLDGNAVTQITVNSNITVKAKWTKTTTRSVTWKRFAGATAPDTMKLIAGEFGKAKVAVVTTDANYKDALAASALAGKNGAIVLMTKKGSLTAQTKQALKAAGVKTVYLVGSTKDVTTKVEKALKSGTGVTKVTRVSGGSASAKAIAAAKVGGKKSDTVIIATQNGFQDALAIAPYSYVSKSPILYAETNKKLSNATVNFIKGAKYKKAIIVGGPIALPASIETQLKKAGVTSVTRLAGTNAYRTSAIIANWTTGQLKNGSSEPYKGKNITVVRFQPAAGNRLQANKLAISTGQNWLDALAGAALCGKNKSVLLLADAKTTKSNYTLASAWCKTAFAKNTAFRQGYIFGGVKAVQPKVETALKTATKITTTNVYTIS
ncbi:MAG: cell wall-binding repeat-containing protein [Coriobacteriales bacterium]|jgi:putative cell wall-binding protein